MHNALAYNKFLIMVAAVNEKEEKEVEKEKEEELKEEHMP